MSPDKQAQHSRPFLITFSGIDGAGKSTQIDHLTSCLQKRNLRVLRLSFWDDAAVWARFRSRLGQSAINIYCPAKAGEPVSPKNHKHIRRWYLTAVRLALYILDVVRLRHLLTTAAVRGDVIIFDRYVYDQLANIYSYSSLTRAYIQLLLRQTPRPDLAFIIDTSPDEAFARKPEYPLDFIYKNRRSFLQLREFCPELIRISGNALEAVKSEILAHLRQTLLADANAGESETSNESAVMDSANYCRVENEPTERI